MRSLLVPRWFAYAALLVAFWPIAATAGQPLGPTDDKPADYWLKLWSELQRPLGEPMDDAPRWARGFTLPKGEKRPDYWLRQLKSLQATQRAEAARELGVCGKRPSFD